jgi:deoxyribonuclease IV
MELLMSGALKSGAETGPRLLFGTAGVPHSAAGTDTVSGVETVADLGLGAMELEFVHGVRLQPKMAERIRRRAEELRVVLTCHGPYYINLNALEDEKRQASVRRILETARAAAMVGARSVTFHAAFYLKQDAELVHQTVREQLQNILETLRREGNQVQIRPELTGKPTQYGSLEELLLLAQQVPGVYPCIDFSHQHARSGGGYNNLDDFRGILKKVQKALGTEALANLHLHVSGIEYSQKGEQRHLNLEKSDLQYRALLRALKEFSAGGVLICESPNLEEDAVLLQNTYKRLR